MTATDKQHAIKEIFYLLTPEQKYEKIIEMGRALPPLSDAARVPENLVHGCQSVMHLETTFKDGRVYFNADSEALISKGLAALLIAAYSGEPPASLLQHPPIFLKDLGLSLSPARSNGLSSLYKKMLFSITSFLQ
jgi:cysteine desulfuration protein SufE